MNREQLAGENQIASLRPDFYLRIRRHLAFSNDVSSTLRKANNLAELERTKTLIYDLVALRLRKILLVASALSPPNDIKEKLTPEEAQVFDRIYNLLQSWRRAVMEGS